jgi:hypothetical protein
MANMTVGFPHQMLDGSSFGNRQFSITVCPESRLRDSSGYLEGKDETMVVAAIIVSERPVR